MAEKHYVVLYKGLEYNDETYSIGGENASVEKNGFRSVGDARKFVVEQTYDALKYHHLYDFGDGEYFNRGGAVEKMAEFLGVEPTIKTYGSGRYARTYNEFDWSVHSTSWHDFIAKCEENGVDWFPYAPEIYQIIEVSFD